MADTKDLRCALTSFLGEDRFRQFVAQGLTPRMRYWQEKEWERFCSAHPEFAVSLEELEVALRICEVHGLELQPDTAALFHGHLTYGPDPDRVRLYPHAANLPIATGGRPAKEFSTAVWYCQACRVAAQQRGAPNNSFKPNPLRGSA